MVPFFLACVSTSDPVALDGPAGPPAPRAFPSAESPLPELPPLLATADVLVIGAGSSGIAAALSAHESGADVLLVDGAEELGGNSGGAGQQFAVGTRWQTEAGVSDDAEAALGEWGAFTGGDGADPNVAAFVAGSAETLEWLELLGAEIRLSPATEADAGTSPRIHNVFWEPGHLPVDLVDAALGERAWTSTWAQALIVASGRVVGARVERGGQQGWVRARNVIVASGGFARNDELMVSAQPELSRRTFLYETGPLTVGAGASLVPDAGGVTQNLANYGLYLHATPDPAAPGGRESLQLTGLESALMIRPDGQRLGDESAMVGFDSAQALLDAGFDHAYALIPVDAWPRVAAQVPGYNWADPNTPESLDADALLASGAGVVYDDPVAFAPVGGIPADALEATFDRYAELVNAGADVDFGKRPEFLVSFSGRDLIALELRPGAAKAFGGARTDAGMRALDAEGEVIPGLYVVGEAAGFLGTEGAGWGFTGSVSACVWGGREAGRAAALAD